MPYSPFPAGVLFGNMPMRLYWMILAGAPPVDHMPLFVLPTMRLPLAGDPPIIFCVVVLPCMRMPVPFGRTKPFVPMPIRFRVMVMPCGPFHNSIPDVLPLTRLLSNTLGDDP